MRNFMSLPMSRPGDGVNEPTRPSKVHQMTPDQCAEGAPDLPRTQRDAALDPPASPRATRVIGRREPRIIIVMG